MRLWKSILSSVLAAAVLTTGMPTHAGILRLPGLGALSSARLASNGISKINTMKNEAGEIVYQFMDEGGNVLKSFVFGKTSPQALAEFAPSKLHNYFNGLRNNAGHIVTAKMKEFPMEAFTFFVAIGAVTTSDLIFKFSENPVAVDQFLQSQKDPIGQLSFGAFMIANGLTSEPLMAVTESRTARFFIPYLGMSVGMVASNITHEIAPQVPSLITCARDLQKRAFDAAKSLIVKTEMSPVCDEAYKAWTKLSLAEKGHEWAPGLFSMVASTLISGGTEMALTSAVRVLGIELALFFTPGGWAVKGAKWTYKVAQMAGFVYLDTVLKSPLTFAWKNAVQVGPELQDANKRMGILLLRKLANKWQPETELNRAKRPVCTDGKTDDCYLDLDRELLAFHEQMNKWREANLEKVLTSHGNWSQYLHTLSAQYRTSRQFYFDFVSDLWKRKYQTPENYVPLMDRSLPLFGLIPADLQKDEMDLFLLKPTEIEKRQIETVRRALAILKASPAFVPAAKALRADEQKILMNILNGLATGIPEKMGIALKDLRFRLGLDHTQIMAPTSRELELLLTALSTLLGSPNPKLFPGEGYLKLLASDPNAKVYENNPFPGHTGLFAVPTAPEYLVTQMFMGTDVEKGEKMISNHLVAGFPTTFSPPMIRASGEVRSQRLQMDPKTTPDSVLGSIFTMNVWVNGQGGTNMFEYLKNGGVREEILGDEKGHKIAQWWEKTAEQEMVSAFVTYEEAYEEIVAKFYDALQLQGKLVVNRGPMANGILEGLEEERAIYLYVLGSYLSSQEGKTLSLPTKDQDFYSILPAAKAALNGTKHAWIEDAMNQWQVARGLFGKIKKNLNKQNGKAYFTSRLTNKEIQDHVNAMDEQLKKFPGLNAEPGELTQKELEEELAHFRELKKLSQAQGVKAFDQGLKEFKALNAKPGATLTGKTADYLKNMSEEQRREFEKIMQIKKSLYAKKIVAAAIQGLAATQQELLNYAQIVNNVSYVENFSGQALENPVPRRCIQAPTATGTQQWLKAQFTGCPKSGGM